MNPVFFWLYSCVFPPGSKTHWPPNSKNLATRVAIKVDMTDRDSLDALLVLHTTICKNPLFCPKNMTLTWYSYRLLNSSLVNELTNSRISRIVSICKNILIYTSIYFSQKGKYSVIETKMIKLSELALYYFLHYKIFLSSEQGETIKVEI